MGPVTEERGAEALYTLRLPDGTVPLTASALVGRDPTSAVTLTSEQVSRRHARLEPTAEGVRLEDLGSANGTYVEDRRLAAGESVLLRGGERLRFADVEARLDGAPGDHPEPARRESPATSQAGEETPGHRRAVRVDVRGVRQTVTKRGKPFHLLEEVTFSVMPGELLALIGPSGAGKSTLVKVLNGMTPPAAGEVLINGQPMYEHLDSFRGLVGYVPQEDIVHRELSVHSVLMYAARLRLPRACSAAEMEAVIDDVLRELDLRHRRDAMVSTLSGGERKRVNIAVELLTRPSLLLLDEPTSGLDPGLERRIVALIRHLTDEGRTVLFVTHATESIAQCDLVLFLARGGYVAFFGPPQAALEFFGVREFAEAYLRLNEEDGWPERFRQSPYYQQYVVERQRSVRPLEEPVRAEPLAPANRGRNPLEQFLILSQRYADVLRGDLRHLLILLVQAPFIATILAFIYRSDTFTAHAATRAGDTPPVANAPELLFLLVIASLWFGTVNSAREVSKERPIFMRERLFNLRIGSYLLSKVWILGLICLVQSALLLGIVSLRVPFNTTQSAGMGLLAVLFLTSLAATLQGLLISSVARSNDQAMSLVPLLLLPQVIFSGMLIGLDELGPMRFVANLVPGRWSFGGLAALARVPFYYQKTGMGSHTKAVFDTIPENAMLALGLIGLVSLIGAWAALVARERR